MRPPALPVAAALALVAWPVAAHETLHEVQRGRAIAVRAWEADGRPLADAAYAIYSPVDPDEPHQEGWTDRDGWLAFVPDAPGRWRVKVIDPGGHGLDLEVDAGTAPGPAAQAGPPPRAPSGAAFTLRPLVGLAAIGAIFATLYLTYRRKGSTR